MSLLAQVKRSLDPDAPDRILVAGTPGIGKSTFGADSNEPIFIPTEDGLQHLDVDMFPRPKSFQDVLECISTLRNEQNDYKTVVVDTLDFLEILISQHSCNQNGWKGIERQWAEGYRENVNHWKTFYRELDMLRDVKGIEIILLCHSEVKSFNPPDLDASYDRYEAKLDKRAYALAKEWVDTHLFMHWQSWRDKKSKRVKTDGGRVIHTKWCPAWDAKTRWTFPDMIPNTYEDFAAHRTAGAPESPKVLKSQIAELYNALEPNEVTGKKITSAVKAAGEDYRKLAKFRDRLTVLVQEKHPAQEEQVEA